MTPDDIAHVFRDSGALLDGHFLLTSGKHSDRYFEKFQLLQRPDVTETVGRALAAPFVDRGIDIVVGPAVGGILLAHEAAKALGVPAIFTERVHGEMALRRGFQLTPEQRVLVVEDVVTTGGSVREVIDVVEGAGARVHGVGLLVDRTPSGADFGVPTHALYRLQVDTYDPENCPLCREGLPLTQRGSRQQGVSSPQQPLVGIMIGSRSDMPVVEKATATLEAMEIPYELRVLSAHRNPDQAVEYAQKAAARGLRVIIAGAGLAAHLAGVTAAHTLLPVVGLPIGGGPLSGVDALYSTVQMPAGTPVATVAIDGAVNAALLAARMIAVTDSSIRDKLLADRARRAATVDPGKETTE